MINIAINGFGRIGKNVTRLLLRNSDLQSKINLVAINDLGEISSNAHLLKYDSIHGKSFEFISTSNDSINVDGEKININQKDFGESRITIENNSMVNLSKKDSDRAFKESKIIQKALNNYSKFLEPDLNFMNPVEGIISSRYGKKRYINDQPRSPHLSLDIAAAEGTKIVSPSKGKVILVGDFFYAGNYIIIDLSLIHI